MIDLTSLASSIIALKEADLELRDRLVRDGRLGDGYDPEMESLHQRNADELQTIISTVGYPTEKLVGKEASEAAWLVIQHAIGRPEFMRHCAKLLEAAVKEQEADPVHLAYLTDRISVLEGRPQLYGTQFDWDENGKLSPNVVDDPNSVAFRRSMLRLLPLDEQTSIMREKARAEGHQAPVDPLHRKQEMFEWKKKVGWVN